MTFSYLFGLIPLLNLNFQQYIYFSIFIGLITIAFIAFVSLKIDSNFTRIIYLLLYIFAWFILGGIVGGGIILSSSCIVYVLIREFSGDYS